MEVFKNFSMSKNQIKENIYKFIMMNTNANGIDLSKVYLAHLTNCLFPTENKSNYQQNYGINCPINLENDPKKMTLVYILKSQSKNDHIFIDIFNQTMLQSTCVNIISTVLMPEIRRGVTVDHYKSLQDILEIDRLDYETLEGMFQKICQIDEENIEKMSNEMLTKLLLSQDNSLTR